MSKQMLCLDGPLNGSYADVGPGPDSEPVVLGRNDYEQYTWPSGEEVMIHNSVPKDLRRMDSDQEIDDLIKHATETAEIR